jgi:hypothetical protein
MLRRVFQAIALHALSRRLDRLEDRAISLLADLWYRANRGTMSAEHLHRVLISNYTIRFVCGTQDDVVKIAEELAVRTGFCVEILVVVGLVHKRSCPDCPPVGELPCTTAGN